MAVALCSFTAVGAQEATSPEAGENSLRDGKSALIYEIVGDFDLTAFEGANLSFKHHYTDNRAYRIGVSVSVTHENVDSDAMGVRWTEISNRREAITLTALKLHYHNIHDRASFYWGVGPRIGYSHERSLTDTPAWEDDWTRRTERDDAGAGILLAIGVEWFLAKELSLLGQYGSTLNYRWMRQEHAETSVENQYRDVRRSESSLVELRADVVRFGLSLYW
ncbi:MAG TPA: hypothetical protein VNN55_07095 [bacterium]|nr:hypothetical protein [bacterium]